jgi:tetratricopeptide (TPR) repeat protein
MLTALLLLELGVIGGLLGPASLGHLLFRRGDYEGAAQWFTRAYAMSRIAPKRRVTLVCNICACYVHLGDYTQAQPYAENAIGEARRRGMRHVLAVAQLYNSVILIRLGDFDRALNTLESVLEELNINSSMRPLAELYYASALLNTGRLEEAAKRADSLRQNAKVDADVRTLAEYT